MININKTNIEFIKQFLLYGVIGLIASGVDSGLFYLLSKYSHVNIYLANGLTIIIGITISFLLNSHFNFKVKDRIFIRAIKFYCVGGLGLILSQCILYIGVDLLYVNSMYVKLFSVVVVAMIQFLLNKFITFRRSKNV